MKKSIKIILAVFVVLAVVISIAGTKYLNRTQYNDSYVNGNTTGNLYNDGLFCESNGTVFFANPDDNNYLYSMDLSGGNLKKLSEDNVVYINADDHYVYYVRNNGESTRHTDKHSYFSFNNNSLCRINRDGGKVKILDDAPCIYASLIGNKIYYLHHDENVGTILNSVGIDGKDCKEIKKNYAYTCNSLGQYFYYNNPDNGSLMRFDTASDNVATILECHCYKPTVIDNSHAYFVDVDNGNALVHTNLDNVNLTTLTTDSIELYNVYGNSIYYQRTGDSPALCLIKSDGSGAKVLATGEYTAINATSYYIYFKDYYTGTVYCTPTNNPGQINEFHPGKAE